MCVAHIISISDIITAGNIICRRQTSLRERNFHANRPLYYKLYVAVAMSKSAVSDVMEESISEKEKEVDVAGHTSLNEQDWTNLLSN